MKKYTIAIVENDEDEQLFMNIGFQKSDLFEILTMVSDGDKLFEWLAAHPNELPDLILSDLNMPGMNGNDIIVEITSSPLYKHIPVIITSTSGTPSISNKCLQLGAADYLIKPDTFVDYEPFTRLLFERIESRKLLQAQPDKPID
jgi:CheY-like chemotaxis protein